MIIEGSAIYALGKSKLARLGKLSMSYHLQWEVRMAGITSPLLISNVIRSKQKRMFGMLPKQNDEKQSTLESKQTEGQQSPAVSGQAGSANSMEPLSDAEAREIEALTRWIYSSGNNGD